MYQVSSPMPQGIGGPHPFSQLFRNDAGAASARLAEASRTSHPRYFPVDHVRVSDRAGEPPLDDRPRGAGSSSCGAAAEFARDAARSFTDNPASCTLEQLLGAAAEAQGFLEANPKIAVMPLGQVAARLADAAMALSEGKPVDGELERLAKRVGLYVNDHPRLADSEFGPIVAHLARSFLAVGAHAASAETMEATEAEVIRRAASSGTAVILRAA